MGARAPKGRRGTLNLPTCVTVPNMIRGYSECQRNFAASRMCACVREQPSWSPQLPWYQFHYEGQWSPHPWEQREMTVYVHVCLRINTHACMHKDKQACAYTQVPERMWAIGECVYMQHIYLCILYIQVMDVNMHMYTYACVYMQISIHICLITLCTHVCLQI